MVFTFFEDLARIYFSITGWSIDGGGEKKKRERHFLFSMQKWYQRLLVFKIFEKLEYKYRAK